MALTEFESLTIMTTCSWGEPPSPRKGRAYPQHAVTTDTLFCLTHADTRPTERSAHVPFFSSRASES